MTDFAAFKNGKGGYMAGDIMFYGGIALASLGCLLLLMQVARMKNKKELVRIVRNDAGEFSVDFTGKKPGRGAYICPNLECLEKAKKSKGLERSFKTAVPAEVYEILKAEMERGADE